MVVANMHEAKTDFSKLIHRVENGEEVIIARAGVPIAKIVALPPIKKFRVPGIWKGKVKIGKHFDELPKELMHGFYGNER